MPDGGSRIGAVPLLLHGPRASAREIPAGGRAPAASALTRPGRAPDHAGMKPLAHPAPALLSDFARGLVLPLRAAGFVAKHPRIAWLALGPVLLALVAVVVVLALAIGHGDALLGLGWERPGACEGCSAAGRFATALATIAWYLAWTLLVLGTSALAGLLVARVASAPIMDRLSEQVIAQLGLKPPPGVVPQGEQPFAASAVGSILEELARTAVLLAGTVALWLPALIPGGAALAAPLGLAWTAVWLFADTMQYALQWVGPGRLEETVAIARRRPGLAAGFTLAVAAGSLVPLAGAVITPLAVVGACLLLSDVEAGPASGAVVPITA